MSLFGIKPRFDRNVFFLYLLLPHSLEVTSVHKYVYTYSYGFLVCFTKRALLKPMERTAPNHALVVWAPATVTSSWAVYANQDGQGSGVIRTSMSVRRCRLKRNAWLKMLGVLILKGDTTVDVHRVSPKASAVFAKVGFCCVHKVKSLPAYIFFF